MKKKKEKTLGDFDNLPLFKVDGVRFENFPLPNIDEVKLVCPACKSENKLNRVIPEKTLLEKKLYECSICYERCYI